MKKLLLALVILAGSGSLQSMELQEQPTHNLASSKITLSPISLPQTYHQLSDALSKDVAQHIFSLQLNANDIDFASLPIVITQPSSPFSLMRSIRTLIDSYGYDLAVAVFKRSLAQSKISICDIRDKNNWIILHQAIHHMEDNVVKLILEALDDQIWTLLIQQDYDGRTPLYQAIRGNRVKLVKLLLDSAGAKAYMLVLQQDYRNLAALHHAIWFDRPEIAKLLLDAVGDRPLELNILLEASYMHRTEIIKLLIDAANNRKTFDITNPEVKRFM